MNSNRRSTIIIVTFTGVCVFTVLISLYLKKDARFVEYYERKGEKKQFSEFSDVYFYRMENDKPVLNFKSAYLDIIEKDRMAFILPEGKFYNKDNSTVSYQSGEGSYSFKEQQLELFQNVKFNNSQSQVEAGQLNYALDSGVLNAEKDVKVRTLDRKTGDTIRVESQKLVGNSKAEHYIYSDSVSGKLSRKRRYEDGLDFKTQKLDLNLRKSIVFMEGDVNFNRIKFKALAGKAEVFLENYNKKLKYYALYDDIRLQEELSLSDGSKVTRKAYAEKLEGFNAERKIVLSGTPKVIQGRDIIKGYKVTLREDVELVEVEDSSSSFQMNRKKNQGKKR